MADPKGTPSWGIFGSPGTARQSQGNPTGVPNNPFTAACNPHGYPGTTPILFTPPTGTKFGEPTTRNIFQNIAGMSIHKLRSHEELVHADYDQGRHHGSSKAASAGFHAPSATAASTGATPFAGFKLSTTNAIPAFGASTPTTATWGVKAEQVDSAFPSAIPPKRFGSTTCNSPFAATKPTSADAKDSSKGSVKASENEVEWLRNRYLGTTSIAVKCGADEDTYVFPREVLVQNFQHFRGQVSAEATLHVLKDTTTLAFARLVCWTQTSPDIREDAANPDCDYAVEDLLDQLIAAHHLGLDKADRFEKHTCCLLATILLRDRRKLSSEHIRLVTSHPAFPENGGVMNVFVRAGMRPFLQSTTSRAPVWNSNRASPGHVKTEEWTAVVQHCRQLRKDNNEYALRVAEHVSEALEKCGRTVDGHSLFYDTLDDDEVKGRRRPGFNVAFSM